MARIPRLNLPGVPQHVIQRGNNRNVCFYCEQDYVVYLSKLQEYSHQFQVAVHSYILMTNHVHLLCTPKEAEGVSQMMQALGRYFVRYINRTHDRTGTLWEGRFKSALVDSEKYFLIVSRYIELNPIRANMVIHPAEYPWSSYRRNALGKAIQLITPHDCYQALGSNEEERQEAYQSLFNTEIPDYTLKEIRDAINKAWVLGDERFKQQIENQVGRKILPLEHGGDRKSVFFRTQN